MSNNKNTEELAELPKNIKIVFSRFCASGFYGDKCICKKCCQIQNKPYDEIEEHKNWVYSQVMTGQSFIVDNVKPMVSFSDDGKMEFGKTFTYFFKGEISIGDKKWS